MKVHTYFKFGKCIGKLLYTFIEIQTKILIKTLLNNEQYLKI